MNKDLPENLLRVSELLKAMNDLHSRLVLWVKARIAQKFVEGEALPQPDPEEHRLLARMDQLQAEAREEVECLLRGQLDPEVRERLLSLRDQIRSLNMDIHLTPTDPPIE